MSFLSFPNTVVPKTLVTYLLDDWSKLNVNVFAPLVKPVTSNVNSPNGLLEISEPDANMFADAVTSKLSVCPAYEPLDLKHATT